MFEPARPAALSVPPCRRMTLRAQRACELVRCTLPGEVTARELRRLDPGGMCRGVRSQDTNTRYVCGILEHDEPTAAHRLVVDMLTRTSHSSSEPPHKHDTEALAAKTQLEASGSHRLHPAQGFAFRRVSGDDGSLDEACAAEDHDLVTAPRGYHPVVAPQGYDLYYLNVMAGPQRRWVFRNDPVHEWMLQGAGLPVR